MVVRTNPTLEIVKLLPHKNCGACGEPLCITFASQLMGGKRAVADCSYLTEQART